MLLSLKTKILAIGGAIIGALLVAVKFLISQNRRLRNRAKQAESDLEFRDTIDDLDEEINQETSHRAEEAQESLDAGDVPEHLRNRRRL